MSSLWYEHDRIDLATDAIRLLRLKAGSDSSPICCELFQAFLNRDCMVPYEALSYVWGDTMIMYNVFIVGLRHQVTANLYEALLALRHPNEDRILWVDAICINQQDKHERGHQVQRMKLICQYAERALIWLGPGNRKTDMVLDWMERFDKIVVSRPDYTSRSWSPWEAAYSQLGREHQSGLPPFSDAHQKALLDDLLGRSWFRRVWVLQEAASARAAGIYCGSKSVPSRTFAMVPFLAGMTMPEHADTVLDVMPGPRSATWRAKQHTLETLLRKFGDREASDPRDRVYALIGMSSDGSNLRADYTLSAEAAIRAAIGFMIWSSRKESRQWQMPSPTIRDWNIILNEFLRERTWRNPGTN